MYAAHIKQTRRTALRQRADEMWSLCFGVDYSEVHGAAICVVLYNGCAREKEWAFKSTFHLSQLRQTFLRCCQQQMNVLHLSSFKLKRERKQKKNKDQNIYPLLLPTFCFFLQSSSLKLITMATSLPPSTQN